MTYWEPAKWVARLRATMTGGRSGPVADGDGGGPRRPAWPIRPPRRRRTSLCFRPRLRRRRHGPSDGVRLLREAASPASWAHAVATGLVYGYGLSVSRISVRMTTQLSCFSLDRRRHCPVRRHRDFCDRAFRVYRLQERLYAASAAEGGGRAARSQASDGLFRTDRQHVALQRGRSRRPRAGVSHRHRLC